MKAEAVTTVWPRTERATARIHDDDRAVTYMPDYSRVHEHLQRLGAVYAAPDIQKLLERAIDATSELLEVAHARACVVDTVNGGFRVLFESRGGQAVPAGMTARLEPSLEALARWAASSRRALFLDANDGSELFADRFNVGPAGDDDDNDETATSRDGPRRLSLDAATVRLAHLARANVLCVLPLSGATGCLGALLIWIREPAVLARVMEAELIQAMCAGLSSRADALATTQRLRHLSNLFDNILESVPHGVVALGLDGRVIALNASAESLFDLKRVFVLDEPFQTVLPQRLAGELRTMTDKLLASPNVESQLALEAGTGTPMQLGVSGSWLTDRGGQRQGYLFVCRDLSLSLEVQKLREVDKLKTEFVNTVSHELKTPLTAILGGLEILLDSNGAIAPDMLELVQIINGSAVELRELIYDLLNLAKFEGGRETLKEAPVDLAEFLGARVKSLPRHPAHQVSVEVDHDLPPVMLDREKLHQAVGNYLTNAIKYSPQGGQVKVRAGQRDGRLFIEVTDQGLGIAPEHQGKVWEKFYRVDASYTAEIEGTGLGLVIVKSIVELHGGEVYVESEPGKGSTFGMRLPLRPAVGSQTVATD